MVRVPKYERMTWRNLSFWSFCVRWWYLALATTFVLVNVENTFMSSPSLNKHFNSLLSSKHKENEWQ